VLRRSFIRRRALGVVAAWVVEGSGPRERRKAREPLALGERAPGGFDRQVGHTEDAAGQLAVDGVVGEPLNGAHRT